MQTRLATPPADQAPPAADSGAVLLAASDASESWEPVAEDRGWRYIVLHHSGSDHGSVESIDAEHRQRTDSGGRNWLGIGYHFVIGNGDDMPDGEIVPTFRWRQQLAGAHAGQSDFNATGIGICVIGDCDARPPTSRQLESLKRLVAVLSMRYHIPPAAIVGHGDIKATDCPGRYFPLAEIASPNSVSGDRSKPVFPQNEPRQIGRGERLENDIH